VCEERFIVGQFILQVEVHDLLAANGHQSVHAVEQLER
jgi:hypothetical protein